MNSSLFVANSIFGENSQQSISVLKAWHAVGVIGSMQISGPDNMCSYGTDYTYSVPQEFEGEQITWSVSGYPYISSGQGTRTITLRSYNSGDATLTATYSNGNVVAQKQIWVGPARVDYIIGPSEGYIHETLSYSGSTYQYGTDFHWSISPDYPENILFPNGSSIDITFESFYNED